MNYHDDAYGAQLLAQLQGKTDKYTFEIIERDDNYIGAGSSPGRYFWDYPKWTPTEKKAIKLVKGKVLDIGAGAGRHSLYLQRKGFDVTSIDNSPGAVKVCKLRGLKKAKLLPIEKIGKFKSNSFDTIIMLGNNFGLFGSPQKAKTLLKTMYKITSPKTQIIVENRNPYKTDDPNHLEYHKLNRRKGRMPGQLRLRVRFEKLISEWFDYLFVSPAEMKMIVKGTGWKISKFITSRHPDYIAVITKE